jgi:hypothetical protein
VRYALQGNVQRGGEKIRINAQLADASSGGQLWAETFDGDRSDLFALQDRITSRIANSIGREIVVAAARESEARKTDAKASDLMPALWPSLQNLRLWKTCNNGKSYFASFWCWIPTASMLWRTWQPAW